MLAALNGAALAGDDFHPVVGPRSVSQVGGVLHQAGDIGTHGEHAVMQGGQQVGDALGFAWASTFSGSSAFSTVVLQPGVKAAQVGFVLLLASGRPPAQFALRYSGSNDNDRRELAGDGILGLPSGNVRPVQRAAYNTLQNGAELCTALPRPW